MYVCVCVCVCVCVSCMRVCKPAVCISIIIVRAYIYLPYVSSIGGTLVRTDTWEEELAENQGQAIVLPSLQPFDKENSLEYHW